MAGKRPPPLPRPASGAPRWSDDGRKIVIQGKGFAAVFDRAKGDFDSADPRHTCAVKAFPAVHVTRYDFGDLNGPNSPPYAVFPDAKTRRFEGIEVKEEPIGLRIVVRDRYEGFAGATSWLMDRDGRGVIACDYRYTGKAMDTREAGIRLLLKGACDEVRWRRWSEWGEFPQRVHQPHGRGRPRAPRQEVGRGPLERAPGLAVVAGRNRVGHRRLPRRQIQHLRSGAGVAGRLGLQCARQRRRPFPRGDDLRRRGRAPSWRCPLGQVALKPNDRLQGEFVVRLTQ